MNFRKREAEQKAYEKQDVGYKNGWIRRGTGKTVVGMKKIPMILTKNKITQLKPLSLFISEKVETGKLFLNREVRINPNGYTYKGVRLEDVDFPITDPIIRHKKPVEKKNGRWVDITATPKCTGRFISAKLGDEVKKMWLPKPKEERRKTPKMVYVTVKRKNGSVVESSFSRAV